MKAAIAASGLLFFAAQIAVAATPPQPTVVTKVRQPGDTPTKASSLAPHPTNRRVFGDPIQPPILGHVQAPAKKPPPN